MTDTTKLNQYIDEGRLIRHAWTSSDEQGRETACLLAAMSPEVAASRDSSACPADIMPQWLAHLTPWMDDAGSIGAWPSMVRRYAAVAARWHVLSKETWRRLDYTARRISLEDCLPLAGDATPEAEGVLTLLRRAEAGDTVESVKWKAAAWAAWAAEDAAAEAAADATAEAAAKAAWAAADRITAAILASIEAACDEAEKGREP